MTRRVRTRLRLAAVVLVCMSLTGCSLLFDWGIDHDWKEEYRSTALVDFLYGKGKVPVSDQPVELKLPIRVGLSFLPSVNPKTGDVPTASDRAAMLEKVRARFRDRPYVTEIVIIPDYYLSNTADAGGFEKAEQLARLFRLDLVALASFDQAVYSGENARSFGYITLIGAYVLKGEIHEAHTIVDLAVIEPTNRALVMRAGGIAKFSDTSTLADDWRSETAVRRKSFETASTSLLANFDTELTAFETRVREGNAPVKVSRRAGAGALDPLLLAALLALTAIPLWRGRRSSATVRS